MVTIQVQAAHARDRYRATETIVLAFTSDPAARWMYPDPAAYIEHVLAFVEAFGGRAVGSKVVNRAEEFKAVAVWLPPGVHPDDERVVDLISRSVPDERNEAMFAHFEQMGHYHPIEPHSSTDDGRDTHPAGAGYGSALLHHALAHCDRQGLPAYLESSSERNIPLYQRHGFEILGVIHVGSCSPSTPMLRTLRNRGSLCRLGGRPRILFRLRTLPDQDLRPVFTAWPNLIRRTLALDEIRPGQLVLPTTP
jgi:GNAT superfamily N-acetyltransferase